MKKLLLSILFISCAAISFGQVKGYTVEATGYMILQGDTVRTSSPIDGEIIKRVGGVWTNGTGGAGSAAVDSLTWNFSSGYVGWYISGSVSDSISLDGRYVEISDTASGGAYYSQNQVDALLVGAQTIVYEIILPVSGTLSGSVASATEFPSGWVLVANGDNLEIEHNLGRKSASVDIAYNYTGDWYRQIRGFNDGYQGHVYDDNNTTIEGIKNLYTAYKVRLTIHFE